MARKLNVLPPSLLLCIVLLLVSDHPSLFVQGACRIEPNRCSFPFEFGEQSFSQCIQRTELGDRFACRINDTNSTKERWGVCNGGCFGEDGQTPIPFGDMNPEVRTVNEIFCKTKDSKCVFPFIYNDTTYHKCAEAGQGGRDFNWCATAVDVGGFMIDDFWGECDMQLCVKEGKEEIIGPKKAALQFEQNGIKFDLTFEQNDEEASLSLRGTISGLVPGEHGLHVHENPVEEGEDDCGKAGGHYNPFNTDHGGLIGPAHHVGDFGNVLADANGEAKIDLVVTHASLYDDPEPKKNIIGKSIVIHAGEDDLGKGGDEGSRAAGNSGPRLACAPIVESGAEWNLMLIIIIAVIVIIVLLVLLIICLIYCYCCKSSSKKRDEMDGLPYANGDSKKVPLYDELSIPFIDASPAPTPKTGRSTERLSFFHRSASIGKSRGSLSSDDKI